MGLDAQFSHGFSTNFWTLPSYQIQRIFVLKERFKPTKNNPKGLSDLPGIDIFISIANVEKNHLSSLQTPSFQF